MWLDMWLKIKRIYDYIFRVILAVIVILFIFFVFITLASKDLNHNTQVLTTISLVTVLFSIPGIVNTLADEFNPKKKKFKLKCECPNCKQLIEMNMEEE